MSAAPRQRRPYLDWLRGLAVLVMIEGHAFDSWTLPDDRGHLVYRWLHIVNGFGAPAFLFLAGVSLALAGGSRLRRGVPTGEVVRTAVRRGFWIFGLAFLFRLQSFAISGGTFPRTLLKVDILNVMGLSMVAGALLWGLGRTRTSRAAATAAAAVAIAMVSPLVRASGTLDGLPDPLEWYFRPPAGSGAFTLFPWAGLLIGGVSVGLLLDATDSPAAERRLLALLLAAGAALAGGGYAASYLPAIYPEVSFWGASPTFFFLRLGVMLAIVPLAWAWTRVWPGALLQEFGRSSLFVYWIHVEMVYGVLSTPLHRRIPLVWMFVAYAGLTAALFGAVRLRDAVERAWRARQEFRQKRVEIGGG